MNIFLVNSPFQYICANEARTIYKSKKNILVIFKKEHSSQTIQFERTMNRNVWNEIIEIPEKNRTIEIPKLISILKKRSIETPISNLFYAEYRSFTANLIKKNLSFQKEVFFDDGALTVEEYNPYVKYDIPFTRHRFFNDICLKLQNCQPAINVKKNKNFEIFTIFDIDDVEDKIIKNNLVTLKTKFEVYSDEAAIGFIGQGAIGTKNHKSISDYLYEINSFIEKFGKPVIYFPHRTESNDVAIEIKKIPKIIYHKSELPLEIELIEKKIKLSSMIGMLSTAMYSFSILYPQMPIYNLIEKKPFQRMEQEQYERLHSTFLKIGIIDLVL